MVARAVLVAVVVSLLVAGLVMVITATVFNEDTTTSAFIPDTQYAVVLDAGAINTRLRVYQTPKRPSAGLPTVTELTPTTSVVTQTPPIASFTTASDVTAGLGSLITQAKALIPDDKESSTKVFLLASGLRSLDSTRQSTILSLVSSFLSTSGLSFDSSQATVLSSSQELGYAWSTLNYQGNTLASGQPQGIVRLTDLAAEIAFEVPTAGSLPSGLFSTFNVAGVPRTVYTASFPGLGESGILALERAWAVAAAQAPPSATSTRSVSASPSAVSVSASVTPSPDTVSTTPSVSPSVGSSVSVTPSPSTTAVSNTASASPSTSSSPVSATPSSTPSASASPTASPGSPTSVADPCLPTGFSLSYSSAYTLVGTSNGTLCRMALTSLLNKTSCTSGCSIGTTVQPPVASIPFYALGAFWNISTFFGVANGASFTVDKLATESMRFCNLTLAEQQTALGTAQPLMCLRGMYSAVLLSAGYNLPPTASLQATVYPWEQQWPTGLALAQADSFYGLVTTPSYSRFILGWRGQLVCGFGGVFLLAAVVMTILIIFCGCPAQPVKPQRSRRRPRADEEAMREGYDAHRRAQAPTTTTSNPKLSETDTSSRLST